MFFTSIPLSVSRVLTIAQDLFDKKPFTKSWLKTSGAPVGVKVYAAVHAPTPSSLEIAAGWQGGGFKVAIDACSGVLTFDAVWFVEFDPEAQDGDRVLIDIVKALDAELALRALPVRPPFPAYLAGKITRPTPQLKAWDLEKARKSAVSGKKNSPPYQSTTRDALESAALPEPFIDFIISNYAFGYVATM
jgi:hypothetical protein